MTATPEPASPTQTETIGWGSIGRIGEILAGYAPTTVFLVAGSGSFRTSGAEAALEPALAGHRVVRFAEFTTNPRLEDVVRGIDAFRASGADLVLAVGGGTAIDIGKAIRTFAVHDAAPLDLVEGRAPLVHRGVPLIAVPTTAGSGSEATRFAVVYVDGIKFSIDHDTILPDHCVVDPALTASLSPRMTAATGMDALAQAIESIWSVQATDASIVDAAEAAKLALAHLPGAVTSPDRASREGMSMAAHLAGRAINLTRTTACHAISYPMANHFKVPHGHAVALTLPAMLEFNSAVRDDDTQDPRGAAAVRDRIRTILDLLGVDSPRAGRLRLVGLLEEVGLETSLGQLGIDDIDLIVREGFNPARMANNPRRISAAALATLLAGGDPG